MVCTRGKTVLHPTAQRRGSGLMGLSPLCTRGCVHDDQKTNGVSCKQRQGS